MTKLCFFDLEANGLLDTVSRIHCLGYATETGGVGLATRTEVSEILDMWRLGGYTLVGHNIICYDLPALQKTFSYQHPPARVIDTLVLARFIFPDTAPEDDKLVLRGKLPGRLIGSHSLEAWGYRLGCYKGDYTGGWEAYSEEMGEYCKQDVEVTRKLYFHCMAQAPAQEAVELEHQVQTIIQRQVRHGVCFNVDRAIELNAEMSDKLVHLERDLKETFGVWFQPSKTREGVVKTWTPARDNARLGYTAGAELTPVELVEFNPGSRAHITKVLLDAGWVPEKFTDAGNPKVDEEVLAEVDHPHVKKILAYLLVKKRLGQLSDGDNGWLKLVKRGRIHGSVNTNGAVTGRMTHAAPNLAQVPSVKKGKNDAGEEVVLYGEAGGWGYEMRDLFTVPAGKRLIGCDASGLELRMLAHYMGRYDDGAYGQEVVSGDIHTANQKAAGLPTRGNAKTFILRTTWDDLGETPRLKPRELREHPTGPTGGNPERSKETQREAQPSV